jgi:hypothetical protein
MPAEAQRPSRFEARASRGHLWVTVTTAETVVVGCAPSALTHPYALSQSSIERNYRSRRHHTA